MFLFKNYLIYLCNLERGVRVSYNQISSAFDWFTFSGCSQENMTDKFSDSLWANFKKFPDLHRSNSKTFFDQTRLQQNLLIYFCNNFSILAIFFFCDLSSNVSTFFLTRLFYIIFQKIFVNSLIFAIDFENFPISLTFYDTENPGKLSFQTQIFPYSKTFFTVDTSNRCKVNLLLGDLLNFWTVSHYLFTFSVYFK